MHDARLNPQSAVTRRLPKRKNCEYKANVLPGKRTQIEVNVEILSIVLLTECPEVAHNSVAQLIVHTVQNTTGGGAAFTVDDRLQMISLLNFDGRIESANVTIECRIRRSEKTGFIDRGPIFKFGCRLPQDESLHIIIGSRTVEIPRATEPLSGTGVRDEVVGCSR